MSDEECTCNCDLCRVGEHCGDFGCEIELLEDEEDAS
jgi:hypothetical protein